MRKITLICLLFVISLAAECQTQDVLRLRKEYKVAVNDSKEAENLYHKLSEQKLSDPVELAYMGASQALMAKNAKGLNKKMSFLKASDKTFDSAIQQSSGNVEIRFLRFAIGTNLPAIIQNEEKIKDDKTALIQNLPKASNFGVGKEFKKEIVQYVLSSGICSGDEENKLKAMME